MKKILIIGSYAKSLINFRGDFIHDLVNKGYDVIALADKDEEVRVKIENIGAKYISYPISRTGMNPIEEIKTLLAFRRIYKQEKPDIVFAYTIKPILWGGLAQVGLTRMNFFPFITGLGYTFQGGTTRKNLLLQLVSFLYKCSLKKSECVIFQNNDNRNEFIDRKIVSRNRTKVILGSGVNTKRFLQKPIAIKPFVFLLIARLLKDKGINEYIEAANIVKKIYSEVRFDLLGPRDDSPNKIDEKNLRVAIDSGIINYYGSTNDVRPFIEGATVFVLPSYHEGLPRSVLEAMSMGRPIITTDVPGCRETVDNGENGFLVMRGNSSELADRMLWFIRNPHEIDNMGSKSRNLVENKFDVSIVNKQLFEAMKL